MSYISADMRERVADRAGHRCEYCQSQVVVLGMPFEIEHVVPLSAGGETHEDNLCLACPRCNRHKGIQMEGLDIDSGLRSPLFNPRQYAWGEHFFWSSDGLRIQGSTAIGRATVEALRMNNSFVIRARQLWLAAGWHPPAED